MIKIKKELIIQIVSLLVTIVFLFTETVYAASCLRVPVGVGKDRALEAIAAMAVENSPLLQQLKKVSTDFCKAVDKATNEMEVDDALAAFDESRDDIFGNQPPAIIKKIKEAIKRNRYQINDFLISRGYLLEQASTRFDSLSPRKLILYKLEQQETLETSEGNVRVFYVRQITPFDTDLLEYRSGAWSDAYFDYVVVSKDSSVFELEFLKKYMKREIETFPPSGMTEEKDKLRIRVSDIYVELLNKGWTNLDDFQRIESIERNGRNHEVEHEVRMRMRGGYKPDVLENKDLEEILAELRSIIEAEEPWVLLAKLYRVSFSEEGKRYGLVFIRLSGCTDDEDIFQWLENQVTSGTIESLKDAARKAYAYFDAGWKRFYNVDSGDAQSVRPLVIYPKSLKTSL